MHSREFEICAETLQACHAAVAGGADRIELCSALNDGGVTPSHGFIRAAVASSTIPVHVLLRPRAGNFVYSAEEFDVICSDLEDALTLGATGVAAGILTPQHEVDRDRMASLVRLAEGHPVTFHRAFDRTRNLLDAFAALVDAGCSRLLTSGGQPHSSAGAKMLAVLAGQAEGRIRVAAGGGVSLASAPLLRGIPGLDFHASMRPRVPGSSASSDPLWHDHAAHGSIMSEDVLSLRAALGLL